MSKNYKKVSVVVCTKNEEKRIKICLESILKNKVDEIILVDGNSKDKTIKIAKKFTKKIFVSKKKSLTYDRQLGIDKAKNKLVAMIDADHILKKDDIKRLCQDLYKFNFDIVQSQLVSNRNDNFLNSAEQEYWDITHNYSGKRKMIGTAPAIYKKKIFKFIRFDSKVTKKMDDTDFCYRLDRVNKFNYGVGETKIKQHHHNNLKDYFSKFIWYGNGDAEFVLKYPQKIFSIIFHQLVRYPIIYSIRAIFKNKMKSIFFTASMGIIRFFSMCINIILRCIKI